MPAVCPLEGTRGTSLAAGLIAVQSTDMLFLIPLLLLHPLCDMLPEAWHFFGVM